MSFNGSKYIIKEDLRAAEINSRLSVLERSHVKAVPDPVPTGSIVLWPSDTPPADYLLCNGQSVSRDTFSDLFDIIGTQYGGSGNSFNVPDYRGRYLIGRKTSESGINLVGLEAGSEDHVHSSSSHNHGAAGGHTHASAGDHGHGAAGASHQHGAEIDHTHTAGNSLHGHTQGSTGSGGEHSHATPTERMFHGHTVGTFSVSSEIVFDGGVLNFIAPKTHVHIIDGNDPDDIGAHSHTVSSVGSGHTHSNPNMNAAGSHIHSAAGAHTHTAAGGSHSHANTGAHTHSEPDHDHGSATVGTDSTSANPAFLVVNAVIRT